MADKHHPLLLVNVILLSDRPTAVSRAISVHPLCNYFTDFAWMLFFCVCVPLKMYLVGLTGGIASGKSAVSSMLRELGCPIIDADVVARKGKRISLRSKTVYTSSTNPT